MSDRSGDEKSPREKKRFNSYYDILFYGYDEVRKKTVAVVDDLLFAQVRLLAPTAGKLLSGLAKVLAATLKTDRQTPIFLRLMKIIVGLCVLLPLFLVLLTFVLIGGTLAGIFGLRNLGEYSFKEELLAWGPLAILLLTAPLWVGPYYVDKLSLIFCMAVLLIGFDFLFGHAGILTLGHAGFAFLGAYLTVFLYTGVFFGLHVPFILAVPIASGLVAGIGFLLGLPSLRVKDHYLLVITLAFALSISLVFKSRYLSEVAGLSMGGLYVEQPDFFSFLGPGDGALRNYYFILISTGALIFFAHNLIRRSQIGRAFQAMKCDHEVSNILGISLLRYKILAFSISAFYAAFAGGMAVLLNKYISIDSYTVFETIDYYVALVLGGLGSVLGAVIGAVFLAFEVDITRFFSELVPKGQYLARIFYGTLLILMIYLAPRGIAGALSGFVKAKLIRSPRRGSHYMFPPPDYSAADNRNSPIKEN